MARHGTTRERVRESGRSTDVQTIIFDGDKFSADSARRWANEHGFASNKVDVTDSGSIRLRQKDPGQFRRGSFRTIELTEGVQAVIGRMNR